ncbi:MAG: hypothetical protein J6Y58_01675 [Clostridiales bacterium]|nr:hypothetical protein [Clostridiales bacterium]
MKKALALVISLILAIQTTGCSGAPRLDISSFEKYALSDLELTKKESQDGKAEGYYSLDNDSANAATVPLDHYSQVYSKASNGTVGQLYMLYYDYQDQAEAKKFYDEITNAEKELVISSPHTHTSEAGDDYLLVLSTKDQMTFTFECLYIQKDVILFTSIILSASELDSLDKEWLKKIDELFDDLRIKSPFSLEPKIEDLI